MNEFIFTIKTYLEKFKQKDIRIDLFRGLCNEHNIKLKETEQYFTFKSARVIPKIELYLGGNYGVNS